MVSLTKRWLDRLGKPPATVLHWDDDVKRFGVRATPGGAVWRSRPIRQRPALSSSTLTSVIRLAHRWRRHFDEHAALQL